MLATIEAVRIYRRLLGAHLRAVLEYRADAMLTIAAAVLGQLAGLIFVATIFRQVPVLEGWTQWEVLCVCAMVMLAEGVGSLFFEGTWHLSGMVNLGALDYLLVRPYPVILQVTGAAVGVNGLGNVVIGTVLLAGAVGRTDVVWSPVTVLWAVLLLASGLLVKIAVSLATNALTFWLLSPSNSVAVSVHMLGDLARYPLTVYGTGVRALLVVVPVAFVGYFPAAALLDKGVSTTIGLLTPVVALACALAAWRIFEAGLRRYESAGT
ncbi:ABC transporter permease [Verrucosispora sp. SN26_14.1]|uniref:ABC transporter permease n=1 Tax=Verrucosispora sp. SN26_14.1 TaxID=2527879 RepID=UPI001F32C345|nr:ABC-2 family transporter protein [Verrucosispora sp. SN26_14.1]